MSQFPAEGWATAVGSFPQKDAERVCVEILKALPHAPVWPQLPKRGFKENMYVQCSEGFPCAVIDEEKEKFHLDTSGDIYTELEPFYMKVLSEEVDAFAMSEARAAGLHAFLRLVERQKPEGLLYLKGQVTGPVSYGLTVTDEKKRSILYHEELYDAILKGLAMKARWQARKLRELHDGVILFIDEPYLSSFGSAYISLTREQVIGSLNEVAEAVHTEGGIAGVHCCGNTDWSILMDTAIDLINFDAYEYFQGMTLYPEILKGFLERGGALAWGVVPTSEKILKEHGQSLLERMEDCVAQLESKGVPRDLLLKRCFLTPSCGTGSLSEELSASVFKTLSDLSQRWRERNYADD